MGPYAVILVTVGLGALVGWVVPGLGIGTAVAIGAAIGVCLVTRGAGSGRRRRRGPDAGRGD